MQFRSWVVGASSIWLLALSALVVVPSASACSLLYQPFDQARGTDKLYFVEGGRLFVVDGSVERTVDEGFFLSYAEVGDGILVAGQDGLGADCSGQRWLRFYEGGTLQWEDRADARVWPHAEGPIVQKDGEFYRWRDDQLVSMPVEVPQEEYVVGWSHDSRPVFRHDGGLWMGDRLLVEEASWEPVVAASDDSTLLAWHERGTAFLLVDGFLVTFQAEPGLVGAVWAQGWYVMAGGRVVRVDEQQLVDLGRDAISVGTLGSRVLLFHDNGYVAFEGTTPVAARNRASPVWVPASEGTADAQPIESTWRAFHPPQQAPSPTPTEDSPAVASGLVLLALALLAWRRA